MKRIALVVFFLVATPALFAASQTQRYVVALRRVAPIAQAKEMVTDLGPGIEERNVDAYVNIPAFAADLTPEEAAALERRPGVRYVEAVAERHILGIGGGKTSLDVPPNPTGQVVPLGVDAVHARDVWPVTRGQGVNVAIIDTGIDYTHPDLAPVYAGGFNEINKTADPMDDNGHGSHVAGTIAAADNNVGVVGIAPGVRVWSVKVLKANGSGTTDSEIAALDWVISKKNEIGGNWVVNLSLGSTTFNAAERDAFARANDAGLVICAASGNESTSSAPAAVDYPAAYPNVLAIGAVDASKNIASFSNQGPEVAVVGPGVDVLSTFMVGQGVISYAKKNTTSYNADPVTGSKKDTVNGQFVYCGLGASAGDFPASVKGNIALIQRGSVTFNVKAKNAAAAGASGVIIYNCTKTTSTCSNDDFTAGWTLIGRVDSTGKANSGCSDPTSPVYSGCKDDPADLAYAWPVTIRLNNADGESFRSDPNASATAATLAYDYVTLSGTSMATPHAAGVAALAWGAAPNADATAVRGAIKNTADDLGAPGFDPVYGYGELNALNAAKLLAPSRFGSSTTPPPSVPHPGRKILRRG